MDTKKSSILDFLSEKNIIEIPLWQREFVWKEPQIVQLYEDIESLINNPVLPTHFFGIIIHQISPVIFSTTKIIDGHQRLVAISIFLCALCNHFKSEGYKKALLFSGHTPQKMAKIRCLNQVKYEYENILINEDFAYMENSSYSKLYRFFFEKIETNNYALEEYFNALKKFEIIELQLSERDNAQLIFDSINSTGIKLSNFEKIKNYVFMGLDADAQFEIWNQYWKPLEQIFAADENSFCQFMISYISMQTEKNITDKNLNIEFNKFYNYKRNYKKAKDIIAELFKFAQYYIRIKNADFTEEIAEEMSKVIALYDKPELYSFLFEITDDFQNGLIPKKFYVDVLVNTYNYIKVAKEKKEKVNFAGLNKTIAKMLENRYEQGN